MSDDVPNEEVQRGAVNADAWLIWNTSLGCILNVLSAVISSGHQSVFGYFGCGWFLFAIGIILWRLFSRRCHWLVVLLVAAFSGVMFCINASMLRDSA